MISACMPHNHTMTDGASPDTAHCAEEHQFTPQKVYKYRCTVQPNRIFCDCATHNHKM